MPKPPDLPSAGKRDEKSEREARALRLECLRIAAAMNNADPNDITDFAAKFVTFVESGGEEPGGEIPIPAS